VLDEDEEIGWGDAEAEAEEATGPVKGSAHAALDGGSDGAKAAKAASTDTLSSLGRDRDAEDGEKELMRKQIRVLVARVSELERSLDTVNAELQGYRNAAVTEVAAAVEEVTADSVAVAADAALVPPAESLPQSNSIHEEAAMSSGSSLVSPFESGTNTDNSTPRSHDAKPTDTIDVDDAAPEEQEASTKQGTTSQHSKSDSSLANLGDEEWDEEENSWS
jgi:hypothetical protein